MDLFQLVNPDKLSMTCVGYAPSCRRRCRNPIAFRNVQAVKEVMRQVVRPGASNTDLKEMLYDLAGYTLCRRDHQNQATGVSDRWTGMVQRHRDDEDDRGSDTSDDDDGGSDDGGSDDGAISTGSDSSDDTDDGDNDNAEELRRRFDELETLQHEFEELLQRQRQSLQDRMSRSTLVRQTHQPREDGRPISEPSRSSTTRERRDQEETVRNAENARQETDYLAAQSARETARDQCRRDRAERVKREEAERQAQREAEAEAKTKAAVEAERLHKEQEAEKACRDRERQTKLKKQQQSRILSWETAWLRYEAAWADLTPSNTSTLMNTDIRTSQIWPTKSGSFASCSEEDVRAFFRCQPGDANRRILRRQALRWHPDRAARLFTCVADEMLVGEVLRTFTMISQVVIGIMGVAAR